MITVFTPTFNRAAYLSLIHTSLLHQSYKDFEWLIVDDGSQDNTYQVVRRIKQASPIEIRYYYKKNGGKHTAINYGVQRAHGDLFMILDSDDELPADSLSTIYKTYKEIEHDPSFAGVCGYMAHRNGKVIGSKMLSVDVSTINLHYRLHCTGDMAEVFRTDILKRFPFPEIKGERFCPEDLVWNAIAQQYKVRVFPKVVYYRDYLPGGLTDHIIKVRMESPTATLKYYSNMLNYKLPTIIKIKSAINYWRFAFCSDKRHEPNISNKWRWAYPFGYLLHLTDLLRTRK